MMTDQQIKEGHWKETGREMKADDLEAFKRFMRITDCEDSLTYQEASERIIASMEIAANLSMEEDPL